MIQDNLFSVFKADARKETRAAFEQAHPGRFLLGRLPAESDYDGGFETGVVTAESVLRGDTAGDRDDDWSSASAHPFLLEVKKRPDNEWLSWISVGRAGNNDLVLRHPSVSKLHGRIQTEQTPEDDNPDGTGYMLIDAGSSNGTWVNGSRLAPPDPRRLNAGDRLRFGEVECEFLDGSLLHDRLRTLPTLPGRVRDEPDF